MDMRCQRRRRCRDRAVRQRRCASGAEPAGVRGDRRRRSNPGDVRRGSSDLPQLEHSIQRRALLYDKTGEEHYNLISALHKSMRNSDPDAAVYWIARMLEAGEDPLYIARRHDPLRLRRYRQRGSAGACRRGRREGCRAFHRHARRQQRARAGGDLPGHRAQEQRRVHRLQRRGGRRASRSRGAGAAASAECTDEADEGFELRQGLPVRARGARRHRRDGLPAAVARRAASTTSRPIADSRRRSSDDSTGGRR